MTNASHLRGSAWLNFPRVLCETLVAREYRADGRRGGDGAFLGRLGHQARAGKRHRAGRVPAHRADPAGGVPRNTRTSAAPRCCGCRSRRATRLEWFEEVERYLHLDPVQFNYSLLTRSQRISHENLRLRDTAWLEGAEDVVRASRRRAQPPTALRAPPMFAPFRLRDLRAARTASSSRRWRSTGRSTACPTDWHLVHYAERAKGGAGLVYHRDDLRVARKGASRPAAPASMRPSTRRPGSASSISCTPRPTPRSASSSGIPAPRARPSSAGRRWTRRCRRATGR